MHQKEKGSLYALINISSRKVYGPQYLQYLLDTDVRKRMASAFIVFKMEKGSQNTISKHNSVES